MSKPPVRLEQYCPVCGGYRWQWSPDGVFVDPKTHDRIRTARCAKCHAVREDRDLVKNL